MEALSVECSVCADKNSLYKCPICRVPYCSSKCCQTHKESCVVPEVNEVKTADKTDQRVKWDQSTDHVVTREALGWLGESRSLRSLLANQHLRQLVRLADTTDEPDRVMRELMLEPLFVEFADECLRVVEGGPVSSDEDSD